MPCINQPSFILSFLAILIVFFSICFAIQIFYIIYKARNRYTNIVKNRMMFKAIIAMLFGASCGSQFISWQYPIITTIIHVILAFSLMTLVLTKGASHVAEEYFRDGN